MRNVLLGLGLAVSMFAVWAVIAVCLVLIFTPAVEAAPAPDNSWPPDTVYPWQALRFKA